MIFSISLLAFCPSDFILFIFILLDESSFFINCSILDCMFSICLRFFEWPGTLIADNLIRLAVVLFSAFFNVALTRCTFWLFVRNIALSSRCLIRFNALCENSSLPVRYCLSLFCKFLTFCNLVEFLIWFSVIALFLFSRFIRVFFWVRTPRRFDMLDLARFIYRGSKYFLFILMGFITTSLTPPKRA